MKQCSKCKEHKELDTFSNEKAKPDGKAAYCKPCSRSTATAWARANPERKIARQKAYRATARGKYITQKVNAKERGIAWEFTFKTWWALWEDKWDQRGCGSYDELVMCRYNDEGSYSPDNVRIDTMRSNLAEARRLR